MSKFLPKIRLGFLYGKLCEIDPNYGKRNAANLAGIDDRAITLYTDKVKFIRSKNVELNNLIKIHKAKVEKLVNLKMKVNEEQKNIGTKSEAITLKIKQRDSEVEELKKIDEILKNRGEIDLTGRDRNTLEAKRKINKEIMWNKIEDCREKISILENDRLVKVELNS